MKTYTDPAPPCERCGAIFAAHREDIARGFTCPLAPRLTFRRRVADMPCTGVAPHPTVPIGLYAHYKGGFYAVVGGVYDAEDDDDRAAVKVRYVSIADGYEACRSVANFTDEVSRADGTRVPRFARVAPNPPGAP